MTSTAPAPAKVVIGLDVGTTATKAVAFGLGAPWRYVAARDYPLLEPRPGWQVQDPETMLAAVSTTLADCAAAIGTSEVVALSVSTAMHGLIGLDAALRPVTPLLTWADARSREEARELRESGAAVALQRTSGTPVHPMTPLTKLMWFSRHEPAICAAVRWWVGLKDYVLWRLTGTLVTELSSASATGLLDLATRSWNPAAVDLAGISLDQLPTILPTTATLGLSAPVAERTRLAAGTPVVLGAGDGPLGNLGTGATSPGIAGLSLGTSGAVRMMVPQPKVDPDGTLFCYALTDSAWVIGGAVSNGGIVVRWAESALAPDLAEIPGGVSLDERLLELAAAVPAGCDGLVMVPYLLSERAPLWDPDLPGAYLGLRRQHGRGHLARAAVEGVCLQLAMIVDRLHRVEPVTSVRITGGAFRSPLWREVMAAALDRPMQAVSDAEGSALGAAALGLHAVGLSPRLEDAPAMLGVTPSADALRVEPDPSLVSVYAAVRSEVPRLVEALGAVADLFGSMTEHRERVAPRRSPNE